METDEIRRIVVNFLNSVLNQTAKIEINKQREQLQRDFGSAAILQWKSEINHSPTFLKT